MTLNNSEFDDVREDRDEDEPLDGRDSQPVTEGSSDDPQTLDHNDPLRDEETLLAERTGEDSLHVGVLEPEDEERIVGDPQLEEEIDPGLDEERPAAMSDQRDDPDLP